MTLTNSRPTDPGTGSDAGVLEDLLWIVPRFLDRTARQIELSRTLLSHVPCVGGRFGPSPRNEAAQGPGYDVNVLGVLAFDDDPSPAAVLEEETAAPLPLDESDATAGLRLIASPEPSNSGSADSGSADSDSASRSSGSEEPPQSSSASVDLSANGSAPVEADLAIPQYDALAASQVIPRLEMLRSEELERILRYEDTHRNRQTIVHKVRALLAAHNGS